MAKSLGNFYYARDVVKLFGTEPVRYFYLSRHWRKPLDFSFEALAEAKAVVSRVYNFLAEASRVSQEAQLQDQGFRAFLAEAEKRFWAELDDDFNTPGALAILQEILGQAYKSGDPAALREAGETVRRLSRPLGLFQEEMHSPELGDLAEKLLDLIVELRAQLRKDKNFVLADKIREKLSALGVELRDSPEGTRWVLRS